MLAFQTTFLCGYFAQYLKISLGRYDESFDVICHVCAVEGLLQDIFSDYLFLCHESIDIGHSKTQSIQSNFAFTSYP